MKELYMTTREFADLVVKSLEDQAYFKPTDVCHPEDLSSAFNMMSSTIGTALSWGNSRIRNLGISYEGGVREDVS
jgi:hypothetical protein